jgi:hypothetical protein
MPPLSDPFLVNVLAGAEYVCRDVMLDRCLDDQMDVFVPSLLVNVAILHNWKFYAYVFEKIMDEMR